MSRMACMVPCAVKLRAAIASHLNLGHFVDWCNQNKLYLSGWRSLVWVRAGVHAAVAAPECVRTMQCRPCLRGVSIPLLQLPPYGSAGDIAPESQTAKAVFMLYIVASLVVQLTVLATLVDSLASKADSSEPDVPDASIVRRSPLCHTPFNAMYRRHARQRMEPVHHSAARHHVCSISVCGVSC